MLAREYAKAIIETRSDRKSFDSSFREFVLGLRENPDYMKIMDSVTIQKETKKELLKELVSGDLYDVVSVLIDNHRFNIILDIYDEYLKLNDKIDNVMRIDLYSANNLSDAEINLVRSSLEKQYNMNIVIDTRVDDKLLKGIRLEFNGMLIDATILNDLLNMKHTLTREAN